MLEIRNAYCGYGTKTVVKDISFTIEPGELLCLLGPNGVGKTTLFKTILGSLKLQSGEILLHGEDVSTWPRRRFATKEGRRSLVTSWIETAGGINWSPKPVLMA